MKLIIEMQDEENYAAHTGFTGEYRWKYKIGSTYVINDVDINNLDAIIEEVSPFINCDDDYFKSYIADWYILSDNEDTDYVKSQKEYDPKGWDTLYLPTELKKNSKGVWFQKRGYIAGKFNETRKEFAHLVGKFVGWVDNLATNKCVLQIEGDKRIIMGQKEAA